MTCHALACHAQKERDWTVYAQKPAPGQAEAYTPRQAKPRGAWAERPYIDALIQGSHHGPEVLCPGLLPLPAPAHLAISLFKTALLQLHCVGAVTIKSSMRALWR